jgi:hypothetical protein
LIEINYLITWGLRAMINMRFITLLFLFMSAPAIKAETIIHPYADDAKSGLLLDILKLSLSKTAPEITFQSQEKATTEDRMTTDLLEGRLTMMWGGVTPYYEKTLMPIHIPVLKGMLGHRIFIIKEGNQYLFDNIQTLDDLKKLTGGQGSKWGDTLVLKNAELPTATTAKYANLFKMLEGDRFDYFPRAIHEPWSEINDHPDFNLTVEKRILLIYPYAMYFMVAPDNQRLHDLIYQGFETAILDGSFNNLFYDDPGIKEALENSNLGERIVLRIPNPNMGLKTPIDRVEFWLELNEL